MRRAAILFAVLLAGLGRSSAIAALPATGVIGTGADDGLITLVYDPADGRLSIDTAGREITVLEIVSAGHHFVGPDFLQAVCGDPAGFPCDPTAAKFFLLKPSPHQFGDRDFGRVLLSGLSRAEIAADLTVNGALFPQGAALGLVDLHYVPEPVTYSWLGCSLAAGGLRRMARFRRR